MSDQARRIDRTIREEALRALEPVLCWRLPPDSWEETDLRITALARAVAEGDAATVREVTAELEMSGRRVERIGGAAPAASGDGKQPPPRQVRERVTALVHTLDPTANAKAAGAAGQPPPPETGRS